MLSAAVSDEEFKNSRVWDILSNQTYSHEKIYENMLYGVHFCWSKFKCTVYIVHYLKN